MMEKISEVYLPSPEICQTLMRVMAQTLLKMVRELLFKAIPMPKESIKSNSRRRSAAMVFPRQIYFSILKQLIDKLDYGVNYKRGQVIHRHTFYDWETLVSVVTRKNVRAVFRLNPEDRENKRTMRIVKILCTDKRKVILTYSKKTWNISWSFYTVTTDGFGHVQ